MKKLILATAILGISASAVASGWYGQGEVIYGKVENGSADNVLSTKDNSVLGFRAAVGKDMGAVRIVADYTHIGNAKSSNVQSVDHPTEYLYSRKLDDQGKPTDEEEITSAVAHNERTTNNGKLSVDSVGLTIIHDLPVNSSKFSPYLGAKATANHIKHKRQVEVVHTHSSVNARGTNSEDVKLGVNDRGEPNFQPLPPDKQLPTTVVHSTKTKNTVGVGAVAGVQYALTPELAIDAGVEYNHFGKIEGEKVDHYGAKVGVRVNF